MPRVSVIIPTYNLANYISETIDSVLAQDYKDYEIIVVDDGSTDNIKETLMKYDGKIKYIYQKNQGCAVARNKGIIEAKGEYIALLDADDIWLPDKLRLQVDLIDENRNVAMVFTDFESFSSNEIIRYSCSRSRRSWEKDSFKYKVSQLKFNDGTILKGNLYEELIFSCLPHISTVLITKKSLLEIGCFDENVDSISDYDLWIRISKNYPLLYFNKVTTRYRVREDSMSGNMDIRGIRYAKWFGKLFEKHIKYCPDKYRGLFKKRIIQSYRSAAWGYLNLNDLREVRRLSFRSLVYDKTQIKLYLYILISFLPVNFVRLVKKIKNIICQKLA